MLEISLCQASILVRVLFKLILMAKPPRLVYVRFTKQASVAVLH